jgi:hypothetical protein
VRRHDVKHNCFGPHRGPATTRNPTVKCQDYCFRSRSLLKYIVSGVLANRGNVIWSFLLITDIREFWNKLILVLLSDDILPTSSETGVETCSLIWMGSGTVIGMNTTWQAKQKQCWWIILDLFIVYSFLLPPTWLSLRVFCSGFATLLGSTNVSNLKYGISIIRPKNCA